MRARHQLSRARRAAAGCALFALVLAAPGTAFGEGEQCQPQNRLSSCISADNVWANPGGGPWLTLYPTATTPAGLVQFGLVLTYLSRPVGLQVASADPAGTTVFAVDDVLDATFVTALGITERLQLSLALPVTLYQNGAGVAAIAGSTASLPRSALGDLRVGLGVRLVDRKAEEQGPALTARFELAAPTGDRDAFVTSGAAAYVPGISFAERIGRVELGADAGARIRPVRDLAGTRIGSQISTALGASVDILADGWLSAGLEAFALFTTAEQRELVWDAQQLAQVEQPTSSPNIPAEWLLSVRSAGLLDGQLVTTLAGGGFIPTGSDSALTVPRFRFMAAIRYVPEAAAVAE